MGIQLYDIMPGRPFGRGTTQTTISADPNTRTYATSSGANVTLGSAILNDGDLAAIHQTYGVSGISDDNWEPFIVASGGGTTSIVASAALQRTYSSGAQVIKVPEYLDLTINSAFAGHSYGATQATSTPRAYGGINIIAVSNLLTINDVINQNGSTGYINSSDRGGIDEWAHFKWWYDNATSGGHIGGANSTDGSNSAVGGNSQYGYNGTESRTPIMNGGAGAAQSGCGSGGGNATAGGNGGDGNSGTGGAASGNVALTSLHLGGGGGGTAGSSSGGGVWTGGSGGGAWIIWAREVAFGASGGLQANGGASFGNNGHAGGSGSGGSVLINCERGAFGTSKVTATAGATFDHGGAGSVGQIRLNYGSLLTGTTNPAASIVQDTKLVAPTSPAMFFFD